MKAKDSIKIDEITAKDLLVRFGEGKHTPGSGSAAAFQGLLSAYLAHTVISITLRKSAYKDIHIELRNKDKELTNRIFPRLEELFELDSLQFNKVIKSRIDRDNEKKDLAKKSILAAQAIIELIPAIEYPIEIAKLSKEIAEISIYLFENGYRTVRGDSSVAVNGSISNILGCLSIVDLNLLSFNNTEWTDTIRSEIKQLKKDYADLHRKSIILSNKLELESIRKDLYFKEINKLVESVKIDEQYSGLFITDIVIEETAIKLQRIIYNYRDVVLEQLDDNPLSILNPETIFKDTLGYQFAKYESLGIHDDNGDLYEVAGIINQKSKFVQISEQFSSEVQNFTAAHELGHAIFHKQEVLHRDRIIDGSYSLKNPEEYQADKFATYFLMPKKQVLIEFQKRFMTSKFVINEDNAFRLISDKPSVLKSYFRDVRDLSIFLSDIEFKPLPSMAKQFNVSNTAMARRLEELGLVEF